MQAASHVNNPPSTPGAFPPQYSNFFPGAPYNHQQGALVATEPQYVAYNYNYQQGSAVVPPNMQSYNLPFPAAYPTPYGIPPQTPYYPAAQPNTVVVKTEVAMVEKKEEFFLNKELVDKCNGTAVNKDAIKAAEFFMWQMRCVGGLVPPSDKNTFEKDPYEALKGLSILAGLTKSDYKTFVYSSLNEILEQIAGQPELYQKSAADLFEVCVTLMGHIADIDPAKRNPLDINTRKLVLRTYSLIGMILVNYSKPQSDGQRVFDSFPKEFQEKIVSLINSLEELNVKDELDLKAEGEFARSCFCMLSVPSNFFLEVFRVIDNLCAIVVGAKSENYDQVRSNFIDIAKRFDPSKKPVDWFATAFIMRTIGYEALSYKDQTDPNTCNTYCTRNIDKINTLIVKECAKPHLFPFFALTVDMLAQLAAEVQYCDAASQAYIYLENFFEGTYKFGAQTFGDPALVKIKKGITAFFTREQEPQSEFRPAFALKLLWAKFALANDFRAKTKSNRANYTEQSIRKKCREAIEKNQLENSVQVNGKTLAQIGQNFLEKTLGKEFTAHMLRAWVCEYGSEYAVQGPKINPYNAPKDDPNPKKDAKHNKEETTQRVSLEFLRHATAQHSQELHQMQAYQSYNQPGYHHQQYLCHQMQAYQQFPPQYGHPQAPYYGYPQQGPQNGYGYPPVSQYDQGYNPALTASPAEPIAIANTAAQVSGSPLRDLSDSASSTGSSTGTSPTSSPASSGVITAPSSPTTQQALASLSLSEEKTPDTYAWIDEEVAKWAALKPSKRNLYLKDLSITNEIADAVANTIMQALQTHGIKEIGLLIIRTQDECLLLAGKFEKTAFHQLTADCYSGAAHNEPDNKLKAKFFFAAAEFAEKGQHWKQASRYYFNAICWDPATNGWAAYKALECSRKDNNLTSPITYAKTFIKEGILVDQKLLVTLGEIAVLKYSTPLKYKIDFKPKKDLVDIRIYFTDFLASHPGDMEVTNTLAQLDAKIAALREQYKGTASAF